MALPDILGGVADYFTGQEANKANLKVAGMARDDAVKARDESRRSLTGKTPDTSTTLNPFGGFDVAREGAQKVLGGGDVGRAEQSNVLTSNPQRTFPTLQDAIQNAQSGVNQQREAVTDLGNTLALRYNRDFGGLENTAEAGAMAKPMAEVFSKLPIAADVGRKNFNEQNLADTGFLTAQLRNLLPQARPISNLPNTTASAINASIPMKPPGSDLEDVLGPQNVGTIIKATGQREDIKAQQDRQDALIKQILASPPQATNKNLLASQRFLQNQMPSLSSLDIPKLRT
jgi:hypothetical protein